MTNPDKLDLDKLRIVVSELTNDPAFENDESIDRFLQERPLTPDEQTFVAAALVRGEERFLARIRRSTAICQELPARNPSQPNSNALTPFRHVALIHGSCGGGKSYTGTWFRRFRCLPEVDVFVSEPRGRIPLSGCLSTTLSQYRQGCLASRKRSLRTLVDEVWIKAAKSHKSPARPLSSREQNSGKTYLVKCTRSFFAGYALGQLSQIRPSNTMPQALRQLSSLISGLLDSETFAERQTVLRFAKTVTDLICSLSGNALPNEIELELYQGRSVADPGVGDGAPGQGPAHVSQLTHCHSVVVKGNRKTRSASLVPCKGDRKKEADELCAIME